MNKIIVALTGASGSIYFLRLIEALINEDLCIHIVASKQGVEVLKYECNKDLKKLVDEWKKVNKRVYIEDNDNLFSPIASGSYGCDKMVILPCSMSTLSEISCGTSKSLLTRAADVILKERKKLIVIPRETPMSSIHLENMLKLSNLGAIILPAMPGFYNHPKTIDDLINFVIGKVLDSLEIKNYIYTRWEGKNEIY